MDFKDLINLCKNEDGKVFIVGEDGQLKLVIMKGEAYQHMMLGKLKEKIKDPETINQEILKAQLQDEQPVPPSVPTPLASVISKRRDELFHTKPFVQNFQQDLRSEVIDPSFDFEAPRVDIDEI